MFDGYLRLLSKHMRLEGNAILDIGCFTGEFPVALEACGATAYGGELQPKAGLRSHSPRR